METKSMARALSLFGLTALFLIVSPPLRKEVLGVINKCVLAMQLYAPLSYVVGVILVPPFGRLLSREVLLLLLATPPHQVVLGLGKGQDLACREYRLSSIGHGTRRNLHAPDVDVVLTKPQDDRRHGRSKATRDKQNPHRAWASVLERGCMIEKLLPTLVLGSRMCGCELLGQLVERELRPIRRRKI